MRKLYWAAAGATALMVAAACSDRNAITETGRGLIPNGPSRTVVTGAAFTTVNEDAQGTGHCQNGNPGVNCNLYDGKEFVWLNGGPAAASIGGAGNYLFAVLSPAGQNSPNDGETDNLSDPAGGDSYLNRVYTIDASGNISAYTGSHTRDGNLIQLIPYDDTPNPGGVYIMAICAVGDAVLDGDGHVTGYTAYPIQNPSACKYDAFKINNGTVVDFSDPTVTKDAAGSYDKTYTWTITKAVDKTIVRQVGGNATFNYTVEVTHDGGTDGNYTVAGTITVSNPNVDGNGNPVSLAITSVTDKLSDNTVCSVTNGGAQTITTATANFAYSCTLSGAPTGTLDNTVTLAWPAQVLDNGATTAAGTAQFTFSTIAFTLGNTVDECVNVTDTSGGTLGQVCVGDANPTDFYYQRVIAVGTGCTNYDNTATFTTNDLGATGSDSKTVTVCGPSNSGALTIGFWKGPNGNSLITNYCAPSGKTSLAAYLAGLGAGSGPFADAAGKSCSQLVTYVNGILNAASAVNMNSMLKAQMLGTALDVYFSDPTKGYSTVGIGSGKNAIKPPSAFLPGTSIGTFKMLMTAICPMVDNLSTGTATCQNNTPSTNAFTAGAVPAASMFVQAILDFAATTPAPFNGSASTSIWYGGDRTKEEILKNIFDQINNNLAFAGP